ncbi:hypothetical protein Ocin01_13341 [Orchesella cincta]|uniref:Uncharacterized protein n=1 Tax=Orchesella cincta TaxID=48709 RepID=A0A1D2MK82_ORCCI|nr:hypothetical protein Ocin01_13341 [Orchesella cincta]
MFEQEYYDSYFTQYYGSYFGSYYGCYISGYYGIFYDGDYSTPLNYAMEGLSRNDWVDSVGVNDIIVPDFACHSENENNLVSGLLRDKGINKELMESCSTKNWQGTCYNDCVLLNLDILKSNPSVGNRVNITLNTEDEMAQEMKENLFNEESERIATKIARKVTEDCSIFDASIDIYQPCEAKTDLYDCVQRAWVSGWEDYDDSYSSWFDNPRQAYYGGYYSIPPYYGYDWFLDTRDEWMDNVGMRDLVLPDFACHSENGGDVLRDQELSEKIKETCNAENWKNVSYPCYNDCVILHLDILTSKSFDGIIHDDIVTLKAEDEIAKQFKENLFNEGYEDVAEKMAKTITQLCPDIDIDTSLIVDCEVKSDLYECVHRAWVNGWGDYDDSYSSWFDNPWQYYGSYYRPYYGNVYRNYYYYGGYGGIDAREGWMDNVADNTLTLPDFACHSENGNSLLRDVELNWKLKESCSGENWPGPCFNDCILLTLEIIKSNLNTDNTMSVTLNTEDEIVKQLKENLFNEESEEVAIKIAKKIIENCAEFGKSFLLIKQVAILTLSNLVKQRQEC